MKQRYHIQFFLIILLSILYKSSVYAQEINFAGFLKNTVESDQAFWVRVHAAEALITNNYSLNSQDIFAKELQGNSSEKIGALRVLYKGSAQDTLKKDSIAREILNVFTTSEDHRTRLVALETMGKLGLFFPKNKEISEIASQGNGGMQTMAQWVVANSGKEKDVEALCDFLFSNDTTQFRYAAYASGFLKPLSNHLFNQLKRKYEELEENHPFRVYLVSALWVHSTEIEKNGYLDDLLSYRNGEKYERYEVFQAFSKKGYPEVLKTAEESFSDGDTDVKVSIAQAYISNEELTQSHVGWLDWVILIVYGILLLSIGWIYSYLQKSKEDYFLGGGNVNPLVSGISMYVSFFSAITYLATAGEVIKNGPLIPLITIAAAPVIFILGSYLLIPFFMNLKMISAYEILEKPLGVKVRKTGSVIFLMTRIVWMALLIFLASKAMVVMMGWGNSTIVIISVLLGIITIVYTTMGGLKAVLATDVLQFIILLVGAVLTIVMVAFQFDGVGSIIPDSWSSNWQQVEVFNFNPYVRLSVFFAFINVITWWVCTTGSDQMAIQRFLSTKDLKSARKSFAVTQSGMILMTFILMLVGFSVLKFYEAKPNLLPDGKDILVDADFLFPHFIAHQFPMGMSGLVIAALFSASMSSLSSGINSTSSVLTMDILPQFLSTRRSNNEIKNIRIISVIVGVVVVLLSLLIPLVPGNIIEVTAKTNGLFIAPLFNLFFMALFIKNPRPFSVIFGSLYGFLAAFTVAFWDVLTGNPPWSFLWIAITSLVVSILSSLLFNRILPSKVGMQKGIFLTMVLALPWIIFFIVI
ncbi:sodium:solute symporter family transporter [Membranihabitans maritimus]|uniref:sodium:solute symporter family transporter n=1 Tax=Membranihabitans maritimus TaxID=2904244 RepID=UPI001EEE55BA